MKIALIILALLLASCARPGAIPSPTPKATAPPSEVHRCSGAGRWFPADPDELAKMVDAYLAQAERKVEAEPIAIVVPHAGYIFCGQVAAYAYKQIEGVDYEVVVVIGDTHTGAGSSPIALYARGAFETPLGLVPIDEEVAQAIAGADERIAFDRPAFSYEHPIENQLPFLQRVCEDFEFVPIVFREPTLENARILSEALVEALAGKKALIVASTDLSHYPPYDDAVRVDGKTLKALVSLDPQALLRATEEPLKEGIPNLVTCMCSRGAVLTAIMAAKKLDADRATVLKYANSGDTPFGDRRQVVSYGAVMIWKGEGKASFSAPKPTVPPESTSLSPQEGERLLAIARRTISQFLESGTVPAIEVAEPGLLQERGVFVTLKKHGQLRGCIGHLTAEGPLYLTVQRAAIAAATGDPRFPPVTLEEFADIEVEISVLSPIEPIEDVSEIEVGRHGLIIVKGRNQGVLLPQVAMEEGWDKEEFLRAVCRKAGLPEDAWRERARLLVFTAEVFGERP